MTRLVALTTLTVVCGVGACGWLVTRGWGAGWSLGVLMFGAGINLGACWFSFIPIALVFRMNRDYLPQAALAGVTIRLMVAGPATLVAIRLGPWEMLPLGTWMVVFYVSLLAVETAVIVVVTWPFGANSNGTRPS